MKRAIDEQSVSMKQHQLISRFASLQTTAVPITDAGCVLNREFHLAKLNYERKRIN